MRIKATSIQDYIAKVPKERQAAVKKLRSVVKKNLPKGFKEELSYGMIGYVVPHSLYPPGYHCDPELPLPFANIASQKHFIALYHMGVYADQKLYNWFVTEYKKRANHKLDMGKSCIRFKKIDDIPYDLIGELMQQMTVQDMIELYEKNVKNRKK